RRTMKSRAQLRLRRLAPPRKLLWVTGIHGKRQVSRSLILRVVKWSGPILCTKRVPRMVSAVQRNLARNISRKQSRSSRAAVQDKDTRWGIDEHSVLPG